MRGAETYRRDELALVDVGPRADVRPAPLEVVVGVYNTHIASGISYYVPHYQISSEAPRS
jgi:hypothetical protein